MGNFLLDSELGSQMSNFVIIANIYFIIDEPMSDLNLDGTLNYLFIYLLGWG